MEGYLAHTKVTWNVPAKESMGIAWSWHSTWVALPHEGWKWTSRKQEGWLSSWFSCWLWSWTTEFPAAEYPRPITCADDISVLQLQSAKTQDFTSMHTVCILCHGSYNRHKVSCTGLQSSAHTSRVNTIHSSCWASCIHTYILFIHFPRFESRTYIHTYIYTYILVHNGYRYMKGTGMQK